jgi:hypothetical protein
MSYVIIYKGDTNQMLTFDNTITNDINRALTFGSEEDAKLWLMDTQILYHQGRLLDDLEVTKIN